MNYLLKTEPSDTRLPTLERDKKPSGMGSRQPVALKNLRGMHPKDQLIIYHTGDEKSAVGQRAVRRGR
jgi:predicted RNA-binding protein with PUA-like domain